RISSIDSNSLDKVAQWLIVGQRQLPNRMTVGYRFNFAEAQLDVMIAHQLVLCCRNVLSSNITEPTSSRGFAQIVQQKGLHTTFEHAAAHQPRVDFQNALLRLG